MKAALSHPIKYLFEKIPHDSFQKIKLYALTFRRRWGGQCTNNHSNGVVGSKNICNFK